MKVLFDAERLRNPHSGLGQLCLRLGTALIQTRPADAELGFVVPIGSQGVFGPMVAHEEATWWRRYWSTSSADIWHATHQDSWIHPPKGARRVLSIMDLNFLDRPDYSAAKKARRLGAVQRRVDAASAISTISEYTATVVRQHLRTEGKPLRVIYLGSPVDEWGPAVPPEFGFRLGSMPFFVFVGVLHPKKNVHTLLPVMRELEDFRLVIAGNADHQYANELRRQIASLGLKERVLLAGPVSEGAKRWLYEKSAGLLFPSLSEGFGLPVVEAMSAGTPVFLSRLTSLPEIGGSLAYYFDSFDPGAMAATIREGLADFGSRPDRAAELRKAALQFSWDRTALAYWKLYESVLA